MPEPRAFLLDELIDYSETEGITLEQAAQRAAEYARQRIPEREIEQEVRAAHGKVESEIVASGGISIVARFFAKSRIHVVRWRYYTQFHVFTSIHRTGRWFTARYSSPTWTGDKKQAEVYLDNLYHDPEEGQFWMHEPYLTDAKASQDLFQLLATKQGERLKNTRFLKVNPELMTTFMTARANVPEYSERVGDFDKMGRRPHLGAKGWQDRWKLIPPILRPRR